jgi:peptidoglycan endopeptidase LytE
MHESGPRSPARLLAPLALVVFALAVVLVLLTASTGDDGDGGADTTSDQTGTTAQTTTATTTTPRRSTYTVKTGDTLGLIAEKTGVPVERLQELNPELDPQALLSGQKINLRE